MPFTVTHIDLTPHAPDELWNDVGDLVELLPAEWTLVGGLMVQLHAMERDVAVVRVTRDIDVLGQARQPKVLAAIDAALCAAGFEPAEPDPEGYAFRYERAGLTVDVLAPDGLNPAPKLDGSRKAIAIPGGSQALTRSETVTVQIDDRTFQLRRPTLLGAILLKSRSLLVHGDPESQREDLLRLLALVEDPRAMADEVKRTERAWLRKAEPHLRLEDPASLAPEEMQRARQTIRLLSRSAE